MRKKNSRPNPETADYTIYTDGGCQFNPGGQGGYGVVMIDNRTGKSQELSGGYLSTTNNRMELMAAIVAIEHMWAGTSAILYSDSMYLINCFTGAWGRYKNLDLFARLDQAAKGKRIAMSWVQGHAGNEFNERCDSLATEAMLSGDLLADIGYQVENSSAGRKVYKPAGKPAAPVRINAMAVDIEIPAALESQIDRISVDEYCEKYQVHSLCAEAIAGFSNLEKRTFKSYIGLKTDGIDGWSYQKLYALKAGLENSDAVVAVIQKYLPSEKDTITALRWRRRGLPLGDCIRKVLVDKEIAQNVNRSVHREVIA